MRFSKRLLGFLLLSAIPIMLYSVSPNLLAIDAVYLALLSVVCLVDYVKTPLFTKVEVSRPDEHQVLVGRRKRRDAARG